MLNPGNYVVSRPVTNPHPDRRHKYDWREWVTIDEGTEFIAVDWTWELDDETRAKVHMTTPRTELVMVGHRWQHHKVHEHGQYRELYAALEAALVPVSESVSAQLTRLDVQTQFGRWLLESGTLSSTLFETLWGRYQNGSDGLPLQVAP